MKKDIDKGTMDMRSKTEETMEAVGKASPVSIPGKTMIPKRNLNG